mmetsp:Transcript_18446/g.17569  ORF Transcript_18446/g.17569 Transcript_18446/m.17569 type:complete len:80 (-) Transcript_18446:103-342(-)
MKMDNNGNIHWIIEDNESDSRYSTPMKVKIMGMSQHKKKKVLPKLNYTSNISKEKMPDLEFNNEEMELFINKTPEKDAH